jgi:DNA-binding CsgD family transcriptional regulator
MSNRNYPLPRRTDFIPSFLTAGFWARVVDALGLAPQQARILCLILEGKHDKEIIAELGISRQTIRDYLKRVFDRHGLEDRSQLVLKVFILHVGENECPGRG